MLAVHFILCILSRMTSRDQVRRIVETLGREQIAARMGVSRHAVNVRVAHGKLPASWYIALRQMATEAGIDAPVTLFSFKGLDKRRGRAA